MNKLEDLLKQMKLLQEEEENLRKEATDLDSQIMKLMVKKYHIMTDAKSIKEKRYSLAIQYHEIKTRCPSILILAEKAIGRRLTLEEVQEVELAYAKKVSNSTNISH